MELPRRRFLCLAGAVAALPAAVPFAARAEDYPSRPVRIVVGYPAGGAVDIFPRLIAQSLSERLGKQFIIDNRPGAGSNIATEGVVKAAPDGYTLLQISASNAFNATLYENLNFNFVRDIAPIASLVRVPGVVVVHPAFPAGTIPEFIAYAKSNPRKINMASAGIGSAPHVYGELFKIMAGVDLVHVPYRGGAQALTDVIGGQVHVSFATLPSSIEYIKAGQVRALAMTTAMRSNVLPELPTVSEFLPGYEGSGWGGIGAPRNTSAAIVDKLNREINVTLADPRMKARIGDLGGVVMSMSPEEFGSFIANETDKWAKVIRLAGIKMI